MGVAGKLATSFNMYQGIALLYCVMMIFSFSIGIWLLTTNGEGWEWGSGVYVCDLAGCGRRVCCGGFRCRRDGNVAKSPHPLRSP